VRLKFGFFVIEQTQNGQPLLLVDWSREQVAIMFYVQSGNEYSLILHGRAIFGQSR